MAGKKKEEYFWVFVDRHGEPTGWQPFNTRKAADAFRRRVRRRLMADPGEPKKMAYRGGKWINVQQKG